MIGPRFRAQAKVRAHESSRQLRYQLFHAVGVIAEALSKLAMAAAGRGGPMPGFMRACAVVVRGSEERGKRRKRDRIVRGRIERPVSLMRDARANATEEHLRAFDAFLYR